MHARLALTAAAAIAVAVAGCATDTSPAASDRPVFSETVDAAWDETTTLERHAVCGYEQPIMDREQWLAGQWQTQAVETLAGHCIVHLQIWSAGDRWDG